MVFGVCAAGAVVLTVNVVLLGGNIGFFQSLCLLGYCLFPLDVAAIVAAFVKNHIVRRALGLLDQPCSRAATCAATRPRHRLAVRRAGRHPPQDLPGINRQAMFCRSIVVAVALAWASWASVPFIGGSVAPARKVLAVYPLLLLFCSMGWLALVKN